MPHNSYYKWIWVIGLMWEMVCIWDDLQLKTGLNLIPKPL
jgi:hypothetical protein